MDIVGMIISLISGGAGGNIVGALLKNKNLSLGTVGNTIAGLVGGAAGGYILQAMGFLNSMGLADMSVGSILGNIGTSGVSGAILTAILGMIKGAMSNKA